MATTNINDIYTNAEKQKKANAEASQILKDEKAAQIQEDNALLEKRAAAAKDKTRAEYNEIYDTNAVNQYISEQRVAESMANAGLTKSGLNATQMTAIQTSRGNADNRARLQEQAAIDDIELQLSEGIAQNQRSLREYEAQQDAQLKVDNAAIDTQATKDAQQAVNDYSQTIKDATSARDSQIKAATAAVKTLAENGNEQAAASSILGYANSYGLSEDEVRTMCGNAGIDYEQFKKDNAKQTAIIGIKDDPTETSTYEAAFKEYRVEQTGRDKLIPELVKQGVLLQADVQYIESLWAEHMIRMNNAKKTNNREQATVIPIGQIVLTAQDQIDGWVADGTISYNAAAYMTALINYHSFGQYMKATNFQ